MRLRQTLCFLVFGFCVVFGALPTRAAETRSGDWTLGKSEEPGKVEFSLIERHHDGISSHQSDWPASAFQGVDFSKSGRQDAHFTISRDAGKIDCEGFLNDGEGAGIFHFQADPNYPHEMQSLGFPVDDEKQFSMAVQDVSLEFARQMKNEHLTDLDTDKLIAFRIFNVNPQFIEDLRASGLKISDSDKLVAFRIHGVSPQMIRSLHQAGYSPDEDTLIAMRIHNVTPEYIAGLRTRGMEKLTIDQLVSLRIHGID